MTKVCCYCPTPHTIGIDDGSGIISHGMCRRAYIKESAKYFLSRQLPAFFERHELKVLAVVMLYPVAHFAIWAFHGFAVK